MHTKSADATMLENSHTV